MRVWTADGKLIAEFGEERRDFVTIDEIPAHVKQAVISAEDDGFYHHAGIEPKGFVRAALANFASGKKSQGASTITMQVARNFFLSSERSYVRKLYEVAMAFKIEANLTKDQILQIYMNQIFLGNRAYGLRPPGAHITARIFSSCLSEKPPLWLVFRQRRPYTIRSPARREQKSEETTFSGV